MRESRESQVQSQLMTPQSSEPTVPRKMTSVIEGILYEKVKPSEKAEEKERLQYPDESRLKDAVARLVHNFDYFPNFAHSFL